MLKIILLYFCLFTERYLENYVYVTVIAIKMNKL